VSTNNNGLSPAWYKFRDVLNDDGFSENGSVQLVSDGSIGGLPHLFQVKFFNSGFIRSDSGTLDSNFASLNSSGSIKSDLIIGLISVLHAQIEVLNIDIQVGEDELKPFLIKL
jgi:hypothetical protein